MPTVDFAAWLTPSLDLPLGGRIYSVRPPSVERASQLLALAVKSEIGLGLVAGPLPDDLQAICDKLAGSAFAPVPLGPDVYDQMVADGVPSMDIDRVAYYAMHYWARGQAQADVIAELMWGADRDAGSGGGDSAHPKAPRGSRSGRRTASASRTPTASTPTTGSPQT